MHTPCMSWKPLQAVIGLTQVHAQKNLAILLAKMTDFRPMSPTLAQAINASRHQEGPPDCAFPEQSYHPRKCSNDVATHSKLAVKLYRSNQPHICPYSQYIDRLGFVKRGIFL
jgi:hypothetical protein